MKHGRRHNKLKEQIYQQRFGQDAPGYGRQPHRPIPLDEQTGASYRHGDWDDEVEAAPAVESFMTTKNRRALDHLRQRRAAAADADGEAAAGAEVEASDDGAGDAR